MIYGYVLFTFHDGAHQSASAQHPLAQNDPLDTRKIPEKRRNAANVDVAQLHLFHLADRNEVFTQRDRGGDKGKFPPYEARAVLLRVGAFREDVRRRPQNVAGKEIAACRIDRPRPRPAKKKNKSLNVDGPCLPVQNLSPRGARHPIPLGIISAVLKKTRLAPKISP